MRILKIALALVIAGAGAAHAQTPFNTVGPFVQYNLSGGPLSEATAVLGGDWVHANGSAGPAGTATVDGLGAVGSGAIGLSATGRFDGSWAWAGWNDTIYAAAGGAPRDLMQVVFWLQYDWSATLVGDGSAYAYIDVGMRRQIGSGSSWQYAAVREDISRSCSHAGECGEMSSSSSNGGYAGSFGDGWATFMFEIETMVPYTMVVGINAGVTGTDATVSVGAPVLRWGGMYAANGSSQFRIDSASGFDYRSPAPIPEAPTLALWTLGLAVLALARRRAHR